MTNKLSIIALLGPALCLPLAASEPAQSQSPQKIPTQRALEKSGAWMNILKYLTKQDTVKTKCLSKAWQQATKPLRFSTTNSTETALADGREGIITNIFEYLDYQDFCLKLKPLSWKWNTAIEHGLKNPNANRPLVLPKGNKLLAYTNYLLNSIDHKNDFTGSSMIKAFTNVCLRSSSNDVNCTTNIIELYRQNVPIEKQICQNNNGPNTFNPRFLELCTALFDICLQLQENNGKTALRAQIKTDELEQSKAKTLEELMPYLKAWQPYGCMLKVSGKGVFGEIYPKWLHQLVKRPDCFDLNLRRAPQLTELLSDNNGNECRQPKLFIKRKTVPIICSDLHYLQSELRYLQADYKSGRKTASRFRKFDNMLDHELSRMERIDRNSAPITEIWALEDQLLELYKQHADFFSQTGTCPLPNDFYSVQYPAHTTIHYRNCLQKLVNSALSNGLQLAYEKGKTVEPCAYFARANNLYKLDLLHVNVQHAECDRELERLWNSLQRIFKIHTPVECATLLPLQDMLIELYQQRIEYLRSDITQNPTTSLQPQDDLRVFELQKHEQLIAGYKEYRNFTATHILQMEQSLSNQSKTVATNNNTNGLSD